METVKEDKPAQNDRTDELKFQMFLSMIMKRNELLSIRNVANQKKWEELWHE